VVSVQDLNYALWDPLVITCLLIQQLNWSLPNRSLESAFSLLPWNDSSRTKNLILPSFSKSPTLNLKPEGVLFFMIQNSYSGVVVCLFRSVRSLEESILLLADSLRRKSVSND